MQQERSCIELYTAFSSNESWNSCDRVCKAYEKVTYEEVKTIYDKYYADEKFVRVLEKDQCPEDQMGRRKQLCRHWI